MTELFGKVIEAFKVLRTYARCTGPVNYFPISADLLRLDG